MRLIASVFMQVNYNLVFEYRMGEKIYLIMQLSERLDLSNIVSDLT